MILNVDFQQQSKEFSVDFSETNNSFGSSFGELQLVPTVSDYEKMYNLPSIENVTLKGNKTLDEFGLDEVSNIEIDNMFKNIFK